MSNKNESKNKGYAMRLFIAINFDNAVKEYLKAAQSGVKNISQGGHFSHEENLHLTLVFLGEIAPAKITQVEKAMDMVVASAFELSLGGLGHFKRDNGDIVWVGVKQNETLSAVYNQLCRSLKSSGFALENRDYKPHLTLARKVMLTSDLKSVSVPNITTKISRISLMKSERIRGELTYTEIYAKALSYNG